MSRGQTENTGVSEIFFHSHIPAIPSEHRNLTQDFMLESYKDLNGILSPKDSAINTLEVKVVLLPSGWCLSSKSLSFILEHSLRKWETWVQCVPQSESAHLSLPMRLSNCQPISYSG